MRYFIAQDGSFETYDFDHNDPQWQDRIQEVSEIVDSTDPDLGEFQDSGGKLIIQEHMADFAQRPHSGIEYYESVVDELGQGQVDKFARMYVSPGADHGDANAPNLIDWLTVLEDWVEKGQSPPADLTMHDGEQERPACEYPEWPRYLHGDPDDADSFKCQRAPGFSGYGEGLPDNPGRGN